LSFMNFPTLKITEKLKGSTPNPNTLKIYLLHHST
jgi:hypothetical protein